MSLSPAEILTAVGVGITCGTALFHGILYLGKLINQVDRHEDRLDDHEEEIVKIKSKRVV